MAMVLSSVLISHFELLPGLMPFASLLHAGRILEKNVYMNMNYSYPTTMYESVFAKMHVFLVEKYYLEFLLKTFLMVDLTSSVRRNYCIHSNIPFIYCRQTTVVHVHVNIFL